MENNILKDTDVYEALDKNGILIESFCKLPKSGQRQVFEVTLRDGKKSILKFVDVTPYNTLQRLEWSEEFTEGEYEQEYAYEIEARSKRVIRELNAAKKCRVLPQLEVFNEYKVFEKDIYRYIFYFETKFEGDTLNRSEIYQKDQNIECVVDFLLQMVQQIKIMHDTGYVHRDITPRNIIFNKGKYKIIDAGLVKSNEEESLTRTEHMIGTPFFMAPEQEKRTSDYTWDFRTDLFPLGIIAIQIFLPKTRAMRREQLRDMHYIYQQWQSKDSSVKSVTVFSKVISRLAIEQRHKRWSNLDELMKILEDLSK